MDFSLSEEQVMIRNMARQFAREMEPEAREAEESQEFSHAITKRMAENGFLGMVVPEEYGGMGTDYTSYLLVIEEIARANMSQSMVVGLHNSLLAYPLLAYGTEAQKKKYLHGLATGYMLGCYSLSEPNAGSDAGGIATTAVKTDDGYVINGSKIFSTNGSVADFLILFVKTNPDLGYKGMSALLVDTDTPGFAVGKIEKKMGILASPTCELSFTDVKVPHDALLGEEGKGIRIALETLDGGRVSVAATGVAMGEEAFDLAVKYAKERNQFGHPIADFQGIQWKLADMRTEIDAARYLTYYAAWRKDQGLPYTREASQAKLFATEMASRCIHSSMQIHGGYGFMKEYKIEQLYRDCKAAELYEGTSEIQRTVIGRAVLKDKS